MLDEFKEVLENLDRLSRTQFHKLAKKLNKSEEDVEQYIEGVDEAIFQLDDKIEQLKIRKDLW